MTEIITSFAMGDSVPEWLIAVEPMSPGSQRGNFRFAVDVDVVETPDVFLVAVRSLASGYTVLDMAGVQGCRLFAASKPVRIINETIDFLPEGMTPLVPMGAAVAPPHFGLLDQAYLHSLKPGTQAFEDHETHLRAHAAVLAKLVENGRAIMALPDPGPPSYWRRLWSAITGGSASRARPQPLAN